MKFELEVLKEVIKRNYLWFIIFFLINTSVILLMLFTKDISYLYATVCYPKNIDNSLSILVFMYQVVFTIYLSYEFYIYELKEAKENITLRINEKKYIILKIIFLVSFTIIFRIIYNSLVMLVLTNIIKFDTMLVIIPIIYHVILILFTYFVINFINQTKFVQILLVLLFSYIMYNYLNINILLFLLIILLVVNIVFFDFKKYYLNESK